MDSIASQAVIIPSVTPVEKIGSTKVAASPTMK